MIDAAIPASGVDRGKNNAISACAIGAMKFAGDPNSPARFKDDATADELREEILRRLSALREAGILDLEALPVPDGEKHVTRSPASIERA